MPEAEDAAPLTHTSLTGRHGFFTRRGGVSTGPYASLNGSLSGGDHREAVLRNRAIVAGLLGVAPDKLLGATQVHGRSAVVATGAWAAGDGPSADALVSRTPGLGLVVITADCAPVLLEESGAGVVAAVHAGWRGAVAGVLEAAVDAMRREGARGDRLRAVVGPCIGQASYEVGEDLRGAVLGASDWAASLFAPGREAGRYQFDLGAYCLGRLAHAGIESARIEADTCADEARFFSHRRRVRAGGGAIGHQMSAIAVPI